MKSRRTTLNTYPQSAKSTQIGGPVHPQSAKSTQIGGPVAVLLCTAVLALAAQSWAVEAAQDPAQIAGNHDPAAQPSQLRGEYSAKDTASASTPRASAPGAASPKKAPQAKSKAEFDAYQNAVAEAEPARLEAAAIGFAQRFPSSELRPFLFQRAMGLYQQANNSAKALEMARAVLKYDPANPVALLGAAQLLAEGTQEQDLDRDARLQEAANDAQLALQHAGEMAQPAGLSAGQFESMIFELRGEAHEVLATVAYKRRDYRTAIDEYNATVAGEKEHTGAVVWLRLAAAHDKLGEYSLGISAIEKAIAASEAGSPGRELAEKELVRLKALAAEAATKPPATPIATPNESQPVEKTENSRSPAASK